MACRSQFCTGGGCTPTNTSVQAWVQAFGGSYDASDPYDYAQVLSEDAPSNPPNPVWLALAEASLRLRAMLFCNNSTSEVSVGQVVTQQAEGFAKNAIALIPVVGQAIDSILSEAQALFGAAHLKAEQTQEQFLAQMQSIVTSTIQKIDESVQSGVIQSTDAYSAFDQLAAQFKAASPEFKQNNAYGGYYAVILAFRDSAAGWYAVHLQPTASSILDSLDPTNILNNSTVSSLTSSVKSNPVILILLLAIISILFLRGEK